MPRSKDLVFYSWIPLSPEVSRLSPYTHAQQHTRTSRTFYTFAVPPTTINYPFNGYCTPSLVENLMSRGRRRTNSGSSVADCVHTAIFQNIRENRVPSTANRIQGEVHTHGYQICICSKKKNR